MNFLKDNPIIVALIGAAGLIIAAVAPVLINKSPNPPEPILPNSIPEQLAEGEWEIVEKLKIEDKSLNIVWKYIPSLKDNTLILKGRKVKVNYKDPTSGEKLATSICTLKLKEKKAEGECKEFNAQGGLLETNVKLEFSDNFRSVTGNFEKNGVRGSKLSGTKS